MVQALASPCEPSKEILYNYQLIASALISKYKIMII